MKPTESDLQRLKEFNTPTVANAVELFNLRPRNRGFMSPEVRCLFPDLGVMVGYAVTARFGAEEPPGRPSPRGDLWKRILDLPAPRVMVMQDLDQPAGVGAYFGEVQSTIHKRLGCVGVVTNGHVRDLDEVHPLGFHYFAGGVCVSHSYVHLVDFGGPVKVGGAVVHTGEVVHADKHGVLLIPPEIVPEIPGAIARITEREGKIISHCNAPDFSVEQLIKLYES